MDRAETESRIRALAARGLSPREIQRAMWPAKEEAKPTVSAIHGVIHGLPLEDA